LGGRGKYNYFRPDKTRKTSR